jgi:hypothetical protein
LFRVSENTEGQRMSQLTTQDATRGHQGDDVATLLARAEALCRAVAGPDLAGTPLYLLPQSRLAADFGTADVCDGFTNPSLDLYLRDYIGPAWHGRGPCIVVNDLAFKDDLYADAFEYVVQSVVLHELAHVLMRPALFEDRPDLSPERLLFETLLVADALKRDPPADRPAYDGHESPFIRVALHLRHRAEAASVSIATALLCAGWRYYLSPAHRYLEALGDEPARMAGALFRDILAARPPPAFVQLWDEDVVAYQEHFPTRKEPHMSVMELFDRIAGKQRERRQQRVEGYREVVAAIAAGQEPDADTVERALAGAGKSVEDLKQAVETYQRRTALKATIAMEPKLEEERREVQQQIAAADRDLEAAERRHEETTAPLHARLREIAAAASDASNARNELFALCDDPDLRRQLDEVSAEAKRLRERQQDLLSQAAYLDERALSEREHADRELSEGDRDHRRAQAAGWQDQAEALRRNLKAVEQAQADLARRREQIEQRMRDW